MYVTAIIIREMLIAMSISSSENPFCLRDAIVPVVVGENSVPQLPADSSNPRYPTSLSLKLLRLQAARPVGTFLGVPSVFIVGRVEDTVKALRCNEKLLAFCNGDGD
jgi:hypothetical protein